MCIVVEQFPGGNQNNWQDAAGQWQPKEDLSRDSNNEVVMSSSYCSIVSGMCYIEIIISILFFDTNTKSWRIYMKEVFKWFLISSYIMHSK